MVSMTICAYRYCSRDVSPSMRRGTKFCCPAHRRAEHRERVKDSRPSEWESPVTGAGGEAVLVSAETDTDSQVVALVHETILLRNSAARLGREARAELAVRCEGLASDIGDSLKRNFGGVL